MIVYLNGQFVPDSAARVSVFDRGFMFGDGVYEVIPVYWGSLFRLEQHLQRLADSLRGIRLANPLSHSAWQQVLEDLIGRNAAGDEASVYLQVTRGVAKRDHAFPKDTPPTVFAMCNPIAPPDPALQQRGVRAITVDDIRWQLCNIKAITLLPNVLMRQTALDRGAAEAILIRDGQAVEGAASNLFIVAGGTLITPPKSSYLLPGITRDLILEIAHAHNIPCREAPITATELTQADEVWLSSSTKEILPVTHIDQRAVNDGKPGALWLRMIALYQDYKRALRAAK